MHVRFQIKNIENAKITHIFISNQLKSLRFILKEKKGIANLHEFLPKIFSKVLIA